MPYWGSSDSAHSHGPCEYCDDLLDVLRREEADNTRLRAVSLAPRDHDGERETLRAEVARLRSALMTIACALESIPIVTPEQWDAFRRLAATIRAQEEARDAE